MNKSLDLIREALDKLSMVSIGFARDLDDSELADAHDMLVDITLYTDNMKRTIKLAFEENRFAEWINE